MAIESSLTKHVGKKGESKKSPLEWPSTESSSNNSSPMKGISQGDSDSESTSVTSSIHGSTSSATTSSFDQDNAGGTRGEKTLEKSKSKSKKLATFGSFMSSRRRAQSRLGQSTTKISEDELTNQQHSSPVEVSDESHNYSEVTSKPMQKFTRTGSLRSVRLSRNKNKFTLKPRKSSIANNTEISEDLPLERATFSSILKDSKFPKQLKTQSKVLESEGAIQEGQFCPYQHCSLHGHHHHDHHEPPPQRFAYLKRRSRNDQNAPKSQPGKKQEVKVTKKVSTIDHTMDDEDFSIEFYSKTRSEPIFGSNHGHDDVDFDDILFGVNCFDQNHGQNEVRNSQMEDQDNTFKQIPMSNLQSLSDFNDKNNENSNGSNGVLGKKSALKKVNRISMWHTIHRHMVSGLTAEPGNKLLQEVDEQKRPHIEETKDFDNDNAIGDARSQETEIRKMFAIKLVREAIEKILLPEVQDDQSTTSEVISEQDLSESNQKSNDPTPPAAIDESSQEPLQKKPENKSPKRWSYLKKVILLTKFVKELEKVKHFNPKKPRNLPSVQERETETVSLRRQTIGDKKNTDEWMLDYALRQVVSELAPTQKRKVALLVKAFETVAPTHDDLQIRVVNHKELRVNAELKRVSSETNDKSQEPGGSSVESKSNEQPEHDFRAETVIGNDLEKRVNDELQRVSSETNDKTQELGELSVESQSKSTEQPEHDFRDELAIGNDLKKRVNAELQRVSSGVNDKTQEQGESSVKSKSTKQPEHDFRAENDLEKEKHLKMWHMIYQHVAIDIATKVGSEILLDGEESTNDEEKNFQEVEDRQERHYKLKFTKSDAVKLVRESVDEILVPEGDETGFKKVKDEVKFETQKSKNWSKLKKLILLKRSIKALESFGKLQRKAPQESVVISDQEAERVDLKSQMMDERKKAEQWMLDYAVQHIVTKLTPARKKRVSMLVEAFEAVVPLPQI